MSDGIATAPPSVLPPAAGVRPRPLRLAQVIDTLQWGGAQKMQLVLAQAMSGEAEVTLLVLRSDVDATLRGELERLQVRVLTLNFRRLVDPAGLWRLVQVLRHQPFDVVHTHLTYANILGVVAGRIAGRPVIASLRSAGEDLPDRRRAIRTLEAWVLRYGASRIMANGYAVADFRRPALGQRPIEVIRNAVSPGTDLSDGQRAALRRELTGDAARPLMIAVGRLTPAKGFADLLDALVRVRGRHPAAALVVAGDGPLRAALEAQAAWLGLEGSLFFLGKRDDVPRLLAASDIFVSASHWEGLPNVVLEAMAAGLAVVATAVGEVPLLVTPTVGIVVPAQAPRQLAQAMETLLEDPGRRYAMGAAGRALVAQTYHLGVWRARMLAMYEAVLSTARRRPEVVG